MLNDKLIPIINQFDASHISEDRKETLFPLVEYIRLKMRLKEAIRLNFICTHNSRRSHLSQIWAQAMAHYFGINNLACYSGGTEATALFHKVAETLNDQGFDIIKLSEEKNPIYAIKYSSNEPTAICFSKKYDHPFNPSNGFAAILTCDSADEKCPVVAGADARIPIKYSDPKAYDNMEVMDEKYAERSLEIGQEMWWVFQQVSQLKNKNE
jgi:arsenate reductase (thioredoxin)